MAPRASSAAQEGITTAVDLCCEASWKSMTLLYNALCTLTPSPHKGLSQIASRREAYANSSRPLFRIDFSTVLSKAVGDEELCRCPHGSFTIESKGTRSAAQDTFIIGSLSARIGFLLDFVRISPTLSYQPRGDLGKRTALGVERMSVHQRQFPCLDIRPLGLTY